jgi:hypothetical protein
MKKDIEWLKEEIGTEMIQLEPNRTERWSDVKYQTLRSVAQKIYQLDEPEVLSQEWIDKSAVHVRGLGDFLEVIAVESLLVPKQELPVIPKYVADWIEDIKPDNSLRVAFGYIAQRKADNHDDPLAFWIEEGNSETFARAWLDGYEVEEEQKYYVLDTEDIPMLVRTYGVVNRANTHLSIHEKGRNTEHYELTEQEIKNYDERYWAFRNPVEVVEE